MTSRAANGRERILASTADVCFGSSITTCLTICILLLLSILSRTDTLLDNDSRPEADLFTAPHSSYTSADYPPLCS